MNGPTLKEWQDLRTIVYHVEAIVSETPKVEPTVTKVGLLNWPAASIELDRLKVSQRALGRFAKDLTGSHLRLGDDAVLAVLPEISALGESRSERLNRLVENLPRLPAYRWLHNHLAYRDCLKTLAFLARTRTRYAVDTREFVLLHAVIFPIQVLQIQRENGLTPQYPTKSELERSVRQARHFARFLDERSAILGLIDASFLKDDLAKTVAKMSAVIATYRKPRDDGTLRERSFLAFLIPSLIANFGDCSLALVEKILAIVDVTFDRSDLQARIKIHRSKATQRGISRHLRLYPPQAKAV